MASETTSFLQSEDTSQFYKKEYKEGTDVKIKRVNDQNRKIKVYGKTRKLTKIEAWPTAQGLLSIPTQSLPSSKRRRKKKDILNTGYPFFGCFTKEHKTTKSKICQHDGMKNEAELNDGTNTYLSKIYQSYYSECCILLVLTIKVQVTDILV